jgi:hypothetical protein
MFDLLEIWKKVLFQEEAAHLPKEPEYYSEDVAATSFDFPHDIKIVFVADKNLTPVLRYDDLPGVNLTKDEEKIVEEKVKEIQAYTLKLEQTKNSKAKQVYDGDHLLIASLLYDPQKKTLFIEARKAKYSLVCCLHKQRFPLNSPVLEQALYGASVVVPLITKDNHTVLFQVKEFGNFHTVAGRLAVKKNHERLVNPNGSNLIEHTARLKLMEKLLANKSTKPYQSRISFEQVLKLSTICIRRPKVGFGWVEFMVPAKLNCQLSKLEYVIQNSAAPNFNEFSGAYVPFNLDPESRGTTFKDWSLKNPRGCDLYPTDIMTASRVSNEKMFGDQTQPCMPGRVPRGFFPISFFQATLERPRFSTIEKHDDSQEKILSI